MLLVTRPFRRHEFRIGEGMKHCVNYHCDPLFPLHIRNVRTGLFSHAEQSYTDFWKVLALLLNVKTLIPLVGMEIIFGVLV
jgi:hypothetical protein